MPEVEGEYPAYETYANGENDIISLIDLRVDENGEPIPYDARMGYAAGSAFLG